MNSQTCCPEFNTDDWNEKVFTWENKKFIKDEICTFMYMPINFGKVMKRLDSKLKSATADSPQWLCLTSHVSSWKMEVFLAVDKDVLGAENVLMSGKYYCKTYEGSFNNIGNWIKDFQETAKLKEYKINKLFTWYTTCPKCAKKYGKNYVAIIANLE
jgi:hypothetical protein